MHIIHEATVRHTDGVIDISLFVIYEPDTVRRYTYHLTSEYILRRVIGYLKKSRGLHRTALSLLNKHGINKHMKGR